MGIKIIVILKLCMLNRCQISDLRSQKKQGFTLVELLVVISIIGLLVAVLVANFMGARDRAKDSQKIQDLNAIKSAMRLYYNDHQSYPNLAVGTSEVLTSVSGIGLSLSVGNYIKNIGTSAIYSVGNSGDTFTLTVRLDAANIGDTDSFAKCGQPGVDLYYMVCAN